MIRSSRHSDCANILVVDDDRDTAESMARLLRHFGHDVTIAHDGYEAIDIAQRRRPNYMLLDIGLPGLDGYQVASTLRQASDGPIVLVAITGYGCEADRHRALTIGFDHFFVKPLDQEAFNALLSLLNSAGEGQDAAFIDGPVPTADEDAASPSLQVIDERAGDSQVSPGFKPPKLGVMSHDGNPIPTFSREVEITNTLGLHLRAAAKFASLAQQFRADVRVACDGRKVNGRSILDLATLAAACGCRLGLESEGPDAEAAVDALSELVGRRFDEEN